IFAHTYRVSHIFGTLIQCKGVSTQDNMPLCLTFNYYLFILLSAGNPGVVGFYKTFMETIYQSLGRRCAVWAVSHAGHCTPLAGLKKILTIYPSVLESGDVFGLNGQIEHKLAFLLEHVPRNVNLVLVGHSIGCYIILELMKRDPELKVLKSLLLFPTIERMAATPQGKVLTPVLCHLRYVLYLPIFLLCLLPESVITCVARLALRVRLTSSMLYHLTFLFSANAMYMGSQEMRMVLDRDDSTIKKNLNKLLFYYGATDHWCPVQYYHDIKRDFPSGDFHLCERGIRHAFYTCFNINQNCVHAFTIFSIYFCHSVSTYRCIMGTAVTTFQLLLQLTTPINVWHSIVTVM
uniref:Lipid droplet-associated hydrolase n=1 Tax=Denticeps clupeoides TaxID=299321 RepID=A0AAY4AYP3_9TELE